MQNYFRIFRVDDDDRLHRFPVARFEQIYRRTKSIKLFAGQFIRFIHAVIEKCEDRPPKVIHRSFILVLFDESGYLDQKDKDTQMNDAVKMLEVHEGSEWEELYQMEYGEPHRWKPTESILAQLELALMNEGFK